MATNLLWYVMAGFLIGIVASTLLEWFFFRRLRVKLTDQRIRELEAKLQAAEAESDSLLPTGAVPTVAAVTSASRTSAWGDSSYRSPGVFLESEEFDDDNDVTSAFRPVSTSPVATPPNSTPIAPTNMPNATTAAASNFVPGSPSQSPSPVAAATPASTPSPDPTFAPRTEQPTPADSLRAKRIIGQSTRQEVLAALRRNSEAVERGEQLPAVSASMQTPATLAGQEPGAIVPPAIVQGEEREPRAQPPALSAARQRWVDKQELTEPSKEYPDDLSKIKGIGDVYKRRLYRAGICTWQQIADSDIEALRRATSAYPSSNIDDWLVQAQQLMEKHGRKDAVYNGPEPDDMTKILGIGPVGASVLNRAGICTYEQLASTSIPHLESLLPIAVAGDLPDFAKWIARAEELADEKHQNS